MGGTGQNKDVWKIWLKEKIYKAVALIFKKL